MMIIRKLFPLVVLAIICGCKKDKVTEVSHELTKWDLIPGNYKVYTPEGVFLYDMKISYLTQPDFNGGMIDFLKFLPFDDFGGVGIYQDPELYSSDIELRELKGIKDSHGNRWTVTDTGSRAYDIFTNDTLEFNFIKDNSLYWDEDDTIYHHDVIRQIAVKQH